MPRKGAKMTKSEIWSLLVGITDELATLSASVIDLKDQVYGHDKSMEERAKWGSENTTVLSVRLPNDTVSKVDERIEETGTVNRNTYLRILVFNDLSSPSSNLGDGSAPPPLESR